MSRALTLRDVVSLLMTFGVWAVLGLGVYLYPGSQSLRWLLWASILIPLILTGLQTLLAIAIAGWRLTLRLRRHLR
jgi:ABC-type spermidine/putrescine transport system permease subunit II